MKFQVLHLAFFCSLLATTSPLRAGQPVEFQSKAAPASLFELYTSEGCSSCPPAERFFSELKKSPRLWQDFVPLAFHVEYWDYIGWTDPFGSKTFSERQREYAARWSSQSVYTPAFVLNGKEWRGSWSEGSLPRPGPTPTGVLIARSEDELQWTIQFQSATAYHQDGYELHAALLGFDLTSKVKAGENRGRALRHDFVVLSWEHGRATNNANSFQRSFTLKSNPSALSQRFAFVSWVSNPKTLAPIQALGGWLPTTKANNSQP